MELGARNVELGARSRGRGAFAWFKIVSHVKGKGLACQHEMEGASNAANPETEHSLFMGLGGALAIGRCSVTGMPDLSQYVGEELAKEAAVTKGRVTAHELRESLKNFSGGEGTKKEQEG